MKRSFRHNMRMGGCALLLLTVAATATPAKSPRETNRLDRSQATRIRQASTAVASDNLGIRELSAAADFTLSWYSFNGGGIVDGLSPTLGLSESVGQAVSGRGASSVYGLDLGFWAGGKTCNCPFQADIDEDGFVTALDLGSIIDILFEGNPDIGDPDCPTTRADFLCDGFTETTDLGALIDHLFESGPPPCQPCVEF